MAVCFVWKFSETQCVQVSVVGRVVKYSVVGRYVMSRNIVLLYLVCQSVVLKSGGIN